MFARETNQPRQRFRGHAGPLFVTGGLLGLAAYSLGLAVGLATGHEVGPPDASQTGRVMSVLANASLFSYGLGLVSQAATMRASWSTRVGTGLGILACVAAVLSMALANGGISAIGVLLGMNLGAVVLGVALLRAPDDGLPLGWAMLLNGLVFFPFIVATNWIATVVPDYIGDDLPFPVAAAIWIAIGVALTRKTEPRMGRVTMRSVSVRP